MVENIFQAFLANFCHKMVQFINLLALTAYDKMARLKEKIDIVRNA